LAGFRSKSWGQYRQKYITPNFWIEKRLKRTEKSTETFYLDRFFVALFGKDPEENEDHGDFRSDDQDDPVKMALDEEFYLFSPYHHRASDQKKSKSTGGCKGKGKGENSEVKHPRYQAERFERERNEPPEKNGPVFVGLELGRNFVEGGSGNEMGYDIRADQIPEKVTEQIADKSACKRGYGGDCSVKKNSRSVLQTEKHEDRIKRHEKYEFERKQKADPKWSFRRGGFLDGPRVEP